ncbi:MAG: DUF748 domain-containing protein, partial [Deltaproteobacteria bacterium]|nr:DUF748 domain-containing protein [Deltaproteobacteria bacterium]
MSEQNTEKKRSLAWRWRVCLAILFLLLVYTLSGFFLLPKLLKSQVEKRSPELLQRQVTIAKVQFNPFTLRLMVDGFVVHGSGDKDTFLRVDSLLLDVAGFLSLRNQALVLEQIEIQGPSLRVIRNRDLSYNFSDILNAVTANSDKKEETDAESGFHFSLNNITMVDGLVEFDDNPRNIVHKIADITIGLPSISNLPYLVETDVEPSFSATVNATPLSVKGTSKPFNQSLETHFAINLDKLDLPRYLS